MLITTSLVSITFCNVCLVVLLRTLRAGEKIKMGGLELNKLKKLKGDKLAWPSLLTVLANAIGLGPMAFCKYSCISTGDKSFGSIVFIKILIFTNISFYCNYLFYTFLNTY